MRFGARLPGRVGVPAEVRRTLPLEPGESVRAAAQDAAGRWCVGTVAALVLWDDDAAGYRRIGWEAVERAGWDREGGRLEVVEAADFGQPQPTHRLTLREPTRLLELVRERITASIVVSHFEPVEGRRGLTVTGRRSPHSDDGLTWAVLVDPGLDAGSPVVRAAAERGLESARSEIGW